MAYILIKFRKITNVTKLFELYSNSRGVDDIKGLPILIDFRKKNTQLLLRFSIISPWDNQDLKIFNIVIHENWKLLEVETVEIFWSSFDCIRDNIFWYHFPFCSVLFLPMYNGPSGAIRPSVCALVALFLYTLKRLSSSFLHGTDVF